MDVELVALEVEFDILFVELLVELDVLLAVEFNGMLEFEVLLEVEFVYEEFDVPLEPENEPLLYVELSLWFDEFDKELFEFDEELLELLLD